MYFEVKKSSTFFMKQLWIAHDGNVVSCRISFGLQTDWFLAIDYVLRSCSKNVRYNSTISKGSGYHAQYPRFLPRKYHESSQISNLVTIVPKNPSWSTILTTQADANKPRNISKAQPERTSNKKVTLIFRFWPIALWQSRNGNIPVQYICVQLIAAFTPRITQGII